MKGIIISLSYLAGLYSLTGDKAKADATWVIFVAFCVVAAIWKRGELEASGDEID